VVVSPLLWKPPVPLMPRSSPVPEPAPLARVLPAGLNATELTQPG